MTEPVKKGREPKYALWELLLRTAEQRKETPANRAVALGVAFRTFCEKANLDFMQVLAAVLQDGTPKQDMPLLASAPDYLRHVNEKDDLG
jgi:hypothetical protein